MHPSTAYLRISEGPDDLLESQLSLTRRLLTLAVAFVLFTGTSLFAMAAFDVDHALLGKAVASKGDDDEDNSGPGSGGDDDDSDSDSITQATTSQGTTKASDSNSDDDKNGASDSSRQKASDDSNSNDNGGNTDSSHGASISNRSHATSDSRGDRTRG
jgi:hypothetical protein